MFFLGHAGCVQVNGVRIAGASGIFKSQDFRVGEYGSVSVTLLPFDRVTQVIWNDFRTTQAQCEVSIISANTTSCVSPSYVPSFTLCLFGG